MTVEVLVPFWDTGCPHRRAAFEWATGWWRGNGFGVVFDGCDIERERASARNALARSASGDVLVFADADTVCDPAQVVEAVDRASSSGRLCHAYTWHCKLPKGFRLGASLPGRKVGQAFRGAAFGVVAVPRRLFDEVGGFDERFKGWGGEDRAFVYACEVIGGGLARRVDGMSFHLWHPEAQPIGKRDAEFKARMKLAERYKALSGHRAPEGPLSLSGGASVDYGAMQALLREPGGPLATATMAAKDERRKVPR